MVQLHGQIRRTGQAARARDRRPPLPGPKSERIVPARITREDALDKWYTEVSGVAKRERDAKRDALNSIASLSKWYDDQPNTPSRRDVIDKLKDKTRAGASLGHSYTPVVRAHSLRRDPAAPAALELGVQAIFARSRVSPRATSCPRRAIRSSASIASPPSRVACRFSRRRTTWTRRPAPRTSWTRPERW